MSELSVEEEITKLFNGESLGAPAEEAVTEPTEDASVEEVETQPIEEETSVEESLLAGRFKTSEDLERGYEELQQKFRERDAEIGELRKLREDFDSLRNQLPAQQPQQTYDPSQVDDFLAENPHQIPQLAEQAIASGDSVMYNRAINAWRELDPMGATDFHTRKLIEAERAQAQQQIQPVLEQQQAQAAAAQFQAAYQHKAETIPDFNEVLSNVSDQQLNGFPKTLLNILQTGDSQAKVDVLETLYWRMKSDQAGNLSQTANEVAVQAQQQAAQARQDAIVASTTASSDRTERVLSPTEQFYADFENSAAFKKFTAPATNGAAAS